LAFLKLPRLGLIFFGLGIVAACIAITGIAGFGR
jgi:hypothetical protein